MPWSMIGSLLLGMAKWFFERKAKKKLDDKEFLAYIEAHQKRRQNAGKVAQDFDDAMDELEDEMKEKE